MFFLFSFRFLIFLSQHVLTFTYLGYLIVVIQLGAQMYLSDTQVQVFKFLLLSKALFLSQHVKMQV